jgi:hypothetical protein
MDQLNLQHAANIEAARKAAEQPILIRSLDWEQAPAPKDSTQSLTVVICPPERSPEIENAMSQHYPSTVLRIVMANERTKNLYTSAEWFKVARRCSKVLRSICVDDVNGVQVVVDPIATPLDSPHVVLHAQDITHVPRELLICADLIFWYNGDGNLETHSWSVEQINKYMSVCTSQLMNPNVTLQWRKSLVDANPWLANCQHWIGMDLRCSNRTWITMPLVPAASNTPTATPQPTPTPTPTPITVSALT